MSLSRRITPERWFKKLENRIANLRLINKQIQNLRQEYGEYEDYYRDHRRKYEQNIDDNLVNVNIQLNYKGTKLIELKDISKTNLNKATALQERLLENREKLNDVTENRQEMESGLNRASRDVGFLTRREVMKRYLLVGIILVLGLLDFLILIFKITRIFR